MIVDAVASGARLQTDNFNALDHTLDIIFQRVKGLEEPFPAEAIQAIRETEDVVEYFVHFHPFLVKLDQIKFFLNVAGSDMSSSKIINSTLVEFIANFVMEIDRSQSPLASEIVDFLVTAELQDLPFYGIHFRKLLLKVF